MSKLFSVVLLLIFFFSVLTPDPARARYAVFNYQRSNGFPGNKIYSIYQDAHHYIWIGTENGLVRFNGYAFKTYTAADGLPDNEVLAINEDPAGRLWISTFSQELCYLWQGKVFNAGNDPLLRRLTFKGLPGNIVFDREGNTWIEDSRAVVRINARKEVTRIAVAGKGPSDQIGPIRRDGTGALIAMNESRIFRYNKDRFETIAELSVHPFYHHSHGGLLNAMAEELSWTPLPAFLERYRSGKDLFLEGAMLPKVLFFRRISPGLVGVGTTMGISLKDIRTGQTTERFLEEHRVGSCLLAKDGSLWFGTLGKGLFHYTPSFIRSVPVPGDPQPVSSIHADGNSLYWIGGMSRLMETGLNGQRQPGPAREQVITGRDKVNVFTHVSRDRANNWIAFIGDSVIRYSRSGPVRSFNIGFGKAVLEEGDRHLLVGAVQGLVRFDKDSFRVTDTILFRKRITALAQVGTIIYAGTLDGLIRCAPTGDGSFADRPVLNGHITALCTDSDNVLWAASSKAMLVMLRNDRVAGFVSRETGLHCNSISALAVSGKYLWVGTDNGLYVLHKKYPFGVARHLSYSNGLSSNQVTCLKILDSRIWVGTDKGVDYFEERQVVPWKMQPVFIINSLLCGDSSLSPGTGVVELKERTLYLDFDVVDHSGIAAPRYYYRFNDDHWMESRNDNLYFPAIPYGHFTLSIKAVSGHWDAPRVLTLSFYHPRPFYLSEWFLLAAMLLALALISLLAYAVVKRARKRDRQQLLVQQNLLQLEQMALQGQMNPHFIFNCITAIRQYYNKGDAERANRFVDAFSALIRTTFEMASHTFTSLDKELAYLDTYLTIERERFDHSFAFSITRDIRVSESSIPVPAMLLQPLVENAVRHGVRHLPDGAGRIAISVVQREGLIEFTITDNGLGRARTQQMKQAVAALAPVTSTGVNKKRVDILNKLFGEKINMRTEDVVDEDRIAGTLVFIAYPLDIYVFGL